MSGQTVFFDLDDTLISSYRDPRSAWIGIAREFLGEEGAEAVGSAVAGRVARFHRHDAGRRLWRLDPVETRRGVLLSAFEQLHEEGLALPDSLAIAMADRYEPYRFERSALHPGALPALEALRARGARLGLLTNGASRVQRRKIDRFGLAPLFDLIQVEEEFGIGKPSPRAYRAALDALGAEPSRSWMVGDDIGMDIVPALALGLRTAWYNPDATAWPSSQPRRPTSVIHHLDAVPALPGL